MKKPILVANWKNHPDSLREARKLLAGLSKKSSLFKKLSTYIAPPTAYFESASDRVKKYASLASQDIFFATDGTYTGSVTADILKSFGVKLAIIGHSERRALGETNQVVDQKIKAALKSGITPLLCIGEDARDPEGAYFGFLSEELKMSLEGVRRKDDALKLVIAYEPIWAIGKKAKDAMQPADLSQMVIFIKKTLTEIFGRESADRIPILYGGSVEPGNAKELVSAGVHGFLVGHASLTAESFAEIAQSLL